MNSDNEPERLAANKCKTAQDFSGGPRRTQKRDFIIAGDFDAMAEKNMYFLMSKFDKRISKLNASILASYS